MEYEDSESDTITLTTGVHQGSVLAPLLLANASNMLDFICFADDTTFSSVMNHFGTFGQNELIEANINRELAKINDWFKIYKLSLNINETKFMIFHNSRQQITIPNMISRSIGVLKKLKYILSPSIKIMIYNALILHRINYGLLYYLAWGYENKKYFITKESNLYNFLSKI